MRDRTKELKKDDESSEEEGIQLVIKLDQDNPMENFFKQVQEIRLGIYKLEQLVKEMETTQLRILSSPVPEDSEKNKLQSLREEIKNVAAGARSRLKAIEPTKGDEEQDRFSVDGRMRRTQHNALSREFVEVMNTCHVMQTQYRERNIERIQRQLKITGVQVTEDKMEEMLETGQHEVFTANLMQDTQVTKLALNEIETRHDEIKRLERSIVELHEMFMYLAMEVEAQGEMVDSIENNVCKSVDFVEKAAEETAAAITSQRKARKKKLCLVVCVSVLVLVIVLIIVIVAVTS